MINFNPKTEEGTLICDECMTEETYHAEDFDMLTKRAKDTVWEIKKSGTAYEHYCFDCR